MKLKIFSIVGLVSVIGMPVFADDVEDEEYVEDYVEEEYEEETEQRVVSTRMTCDAIKKRIAELQEEADPELQTELDSLLVRQRSQCAGRGKRRPVRDYANAAPSIELEENVVADVAPAGNEPAVEPGNDLSPEPPAQPTAQVVPDVNLDAKIAENLANGLCGDGAKPNKYGCCKGEKFKEVSSLKFACCPKSGEGECHEPLKKK